MTRSKRRPADHAGVLEGNLAQGAVTLIRRVLIVRESDAGDRLLFFEMLYKTVHAHLNKHPGFARLLEFGRDVFDNPHRYGAVLLGDSKARTALFLLDDTLVMFHMGSAALDTFDPEPLRPLKVGSEQQGTNATETNRFTSHLLEVLYKYRPAELLVYGIHRIVRDLDNAGRLAEAVRELRITVCTANETFDLNRSQDALVWGILAAFAAAERDSIVERNCLGRIASARRNDWPHNANYVPFGYKLEGPTIVPDAAQVDVVRKMLELLANPDLSSREFADQIGAMGLSRPQQRRIHGELSTVAALLHPKDLVRSITNWLPLYESGVYRFQLPCPTKTGELFGGLPVFHVASASPPGGDTASPPAGARRYIVLSFEYGMPDGGWAPPSVFEAIRQRLGTNKAFTTQSTARRRPFSALPAYAHGDDILQIDSNTVSGYRIRRITYLDDHVTKHARSGTAEAPRNAVHTATTVATVDLTLLHTSVAQGIIDQLSSLIGVEGEIREDLVLGRVSTRDEQRHLLEQRLQRLEQEQLRAAENAASLSSSGGIGAFIAVANSKQREIDAVRLELEASTNSIAVATAVITNAAFVGALAQLSNTREAVDHNVAVALRNMIPRFELYPGQTLGLLHWSADVRIPLADGAVLQVGPITGEIKARSFTGLPVRRKKRPGREAEAHTQAVIDLWCQGVAVAAIGEHRGHTPQMVTKMINNRLTAGGFSTQSATVLSRAFAKETRQVALNAAALGIPRWIIDSAPSLDEIARRVEQDQVVPDGCSLEWATHVIVTYLNEDLSASRHHKRVRTIEKYAKALDAVVKGQSTVGELAQIITDPGRALSHHQHAVAFLDRPNSPLRHAEPWDVHNSGTVSTNRYQPHPCPRCALPMTVYRHVPEVEGALLCAHCRISQAATTPIYPASYVLPDEHTAPTGPLRQPLPLAANVFQPDERKAIIDDYVAGVQVNKILEQYNLNTHEFYRLLQEAGIARRHPYRRRNDPQP